METESFQVYRHSGKFYAHGPIVAVIVAVVAGFPLGYAYAYLMKWIPLIYLNFLVTLGYGFLFGFLTGALMRWGKVRNTPIVLVASLVVGSIALYFSWNGHIHSLFTDAPIICWPNEMFAGMKWLYDKGSWGLHGSGEVTGIPLAIFWVIEAAIILGLTAVTAVGMISSTPFCENALCWLDKKRTINTLALFTDPAQVAAIKSGDLRPLTQAQPKLAGADRWTRLTLKYSPSTEALYTVRLQNITRQVQKDGKIKETAENLTGDLIVPKSMFELIAKFQKFRDPNEPPDEPEEPEPEAAGGTASPQV
jgi:hypothetical protein